MSGDTAKTELPVEWINKTRDEYIAHRDRDGLQYQTSHREGDRVALIAACVLLVLSVASLKAASGNVLLVIAAVAALVSIGSSLLSQIYSAEAFRVEIENIDAEANEVGFTLDFWKNLAKRQESNRFILRTLRMNMLTMVAVFLALLAFAVYVLSV